MKILVIGASGLIGSYLIKSFAKNKNVSVMGTFLQNHYNEPLTRLDINDKYQVESIIQSFQPDIIYLPAAYTDVDRCVNNEKHSYNINVLGVKNVVDAINSYCKNSSLVFFSTDYIFNQKSTPTIDDIPGPFYNHQNIYGQHKFMAEHYIASKLAYCRIVRTCSVFGHDKKGKNFASQILQKLENKENINISNQHYSNPIHAADLVSCVRMYTGNKTLVHVAGNEYLSRYDFAKIIAAKFGYSDNIIESNNKSSNNRPLKGGLVPYPRQMEIKLEHGLTKLYYEVKGIK